MEPAFPARWSPGGWPKKHHKKVLILEKRPHIGGNMYEETLENGVRVHRYGPHIFHTRSREVFEYLQRFSDFYPYEHRVLGKIDGKNGADSHSTSHL